MKKIIKSSYVENILIITLSFYIVEIIFRLISGSSLISFSLIRILIGNLLFSIVIAFILNFCNKIVRKIFTYFFIILFSIYSYLQLGFHNFLGVYMSFQTSSQLGAVKSYVKDFLMSFKLIYILVFIPLILLIIYSIIFKNKKEKLEYKTSSIVSLISLIVLMILYSISVILPVFQNKYQTISNKELFLTASNPSMVIDQFGSFGFCVLDFKVMIHPVVIKEDYEVKQDVKTSINENTRVIDDTNLLSLIDNEKNDTLNYLNKYFVSRSITDKNEMTSLFEGKNLIVIMMESVNDIFINEEYYPNFYKMLNDGWYFENNYSPRNSCATMNNEFSGMTSLYSIYNTCTASKYRSNTYYESMFNLFNNKGYETFSSHNYTQAYYPRKIIHTNMGSGEYFGVEKLKIKYSNEYINWSNDDEFMESILKIIDTKTKDNKPFMTWLTTVSSHQPYSVDSIQGNKYYNMTKNTKYPADIRRYMSKLKILDNGLGILLEGLKERGILDDTVIIMYGDHYPYGISTKNINKVLDYNTSVDMNAERVPFVIYNSKIDAHVYSEYTSYINILPTIANLFNLDYDPRLYLGQDLFSNDYKSITVFADASWKNEYAYYNASKNKIKYYSSFEYTPEEIKAINDDINTKIQVSSKVIKNNYFKYLNEALQKEQEKRDAYEETICDITDLKEESN